MRRLYTLFMATALGGAAAISLPAQTMEQLPAGVTLRINAGSDSYTGVLVSQSSDSVWLSGKGLARGVHAVAVPQIRSVERSEPEYAKSMLLGGLVGLGVGSVVYFSNAQRDRGISFGAGISLGAVAGLIWPRMRWVGVSLR